MIGHYHVSRLESINSVAIRNLKLKHIVDPGEHAHHQKTRRMGRYMVLRVKDNNPLGTVKTLSLDFNEE